MAPEEKSTKESGAAAGDKHQIDKENPSAKKPKTKQATLEETLDSKTDKKDEEKNGDDKEEMKKEEHETPADAEEQTSTKEENGNDGEEDTEGAVLEGEMPDMPSSVLEKGIFYFFMRGRVGIDEPSSVDDIARSFILLRPLALNAKLGSGPIPDSSDTRLLALPKKVLPQSGKDRFMVFVEKVGASLKEIKETFLASSDYETKTAGTRHSPAATPVGEGVYAITTTGRESHLAYILTLPERRDSVHAMLGLKDEGSFILSTKNPNYGGPANAQLSEPPKFSKEIIDEFRSLRWLPSKPEHLDYVNAQVLLVGESTGLKKALEQQKKDQEAGEKEPREAMDELEEEDLHRMKDIPGDESASIYADLEANAKDYPKIQSTF